jgi:hypothetical protein
VSVRAVRRVLEASCGDSLVRDSGAGCAIAAEAADEIQRALCSLR